MVLVQLVTVEDCPEFDCPGCGVAEEVFRRVLGVLNIEMPPHQDGQTAEVFLADGRQVEITHTTCDKLRELGLEPTDAPYILVDGEVVTKGTEWTSESLSREVVEALMPGGWADLRP